MKDITLVSHLQSIAQSAKAPAAEAATGFGEALKDAVEAVNSQQAEANKAVEKLQTGEAGAIHEVMIAGEKADISLRLLVQVRNKVVEAYQEIMRMQV